MRDLDAINPPYARPSRFISLGAMLPLLLSLCCAACQLVRRRRWRCWTTRLHYSVWPFVPCPPSWWQFHASSVWLVQTQSSRLAATVQERPTRASLPQAFSIPIYAPFPEGDPRRDTGVVLRGKKMANNMYTAFNSRTNTPYGPYNIQTFRGDAYIAYRYLIVPGTDSCPP